MDFRYLTETKNEFNNFLCGILVPHLYTGISGMLEHSIQTYNMLEEKQKKNKNIQNPGIVNIFKMYLNDVSGINNNEIENEYKRIKEKSGCSEWFDNLIKASFKSYVLFLTWDPKTSNSKYSENDFYDKISLKDFIHKCYIESCDYFKENPEIFLKKNSKKEIDEIIKNCIETAIKKSLPYNDIIQEFLKINFMVETENNEKNKKEIENIKNLMFRIMSQNKYGNRPITKALLTDSSDKLNRKYEKQMNSDREEIEKFINIENTQQGGNNEYVENIQNETKEIFKPQSAKNSSKNSDDLSDDFKLPEYNKDNFSKTSKTSKTNETSLINSDNEQQNKINETTTQLMTRTELKNKELDFVIKDAESRMSKSSETSETEKNINKKITNNIKENNQTGGSKKKVQIIKNKSNSIHDKVSNYDKYFNTLINN
jgi:hypothetical protein